MNSYIGLYLYLFIAMRSVPALKKLECVPADGHPPLNWSTPQ